jgi:hypothetical protein
MDDLGCRLSDSIGENIAHVPYYRQYYRKAHYVHPGFKGKCSIKKVLPALAAELRYDQLTIREGGQAADAWRRMVAPDTPRDEKARIARDLKIYCGLDTYAMYAIWHHLQELISDGPVPARSRYAPIHAPAAVVGETVVVPPEERVAA